MFGGCSVCGASITAYNACPSRRQYWCCEDCIGDDGYATVEEADVAIFGTPVWVVLYSYGRELDVSVHGGLAAAEHAFYCAIYNCHYEEYTTADCVKGARLHDTHWVEIRTSRLQHRTPSLTAGRAPACPALGGYHANDCRRGT